MLDKEKIIGKVTKVNSSTVTIELSDDLSNLTKNSFYGVEYIGKINSFVVIRSASSKIVAQVTSIQLDEEYNQKKSLSFRSGKKILYAELIGEIKGNHRGNNEFEYGVTNYPLLASPGEFISNDELDIVFGVCTGSLDDDKYHVQIGKSAVFEKYDVKINADVFFGKHAAILGNTGSGKSCTIAATLQSIFEDTRMKNGHFIIFDTNGEYKKALFPKEEKNELLDRINALYVSADEINGNLHIPHWFLNQQEYIDLFTPAEQNQLPVLMRALSIAKLMGKATIPEAFRKSFTFYTFLLIKQLLRDSDKGYDCPRKVFGALSKYEEEMKEDIFADVKPVIEALRTSMIDFKGYMQSQNLGNLIDQCSTVIDKYKEDNDTMPSIDKPTYFDFDNFVKQYLPLSEMVDESSGNTRVKEFCSTMMLRIKRYYDDPRYDFLFKNEDFPQALAIFLRFITGLLSQSPDYSKQTNTYIETLSHADTVKNKSDVSQVVIIDLSSLNSDIIENITAILGRLVLDFLQHPLTERGKFPVCMILEEAHRYIPETRSSPAKYVFERIAKEGRKFGLGLVVSSQRPSELSRTVLSQCNSFIVHKIQNPEDLTHVERMTPYINKDIFKQLPVIPRQYALVFGECVKFPILFKVRNAEPKPESGDSEYSLHWLDENVEYPDFEKICLAWESASSSSIESVKPTSESMPIDTPSTPEQSKEQEAVDKSPDIQYASEVKAEDLPF